LPQWTKDGKKVYTTLLQVLDNHVVDYVPPSVLQEKSSLKNRTKDGLLGMALVGAVSIDPRLYTTQYVDLFQNSGVPPKRKLTKFMITENAAVQPGTPLYASHFRVGDYVDVGANTIVQDDDYLGTIIFEGTDGTNFIRSASIGCGVDGTPGANDMPGRLVFSTTAASASSPTEHARINQAGAFKATTSGTYNNSSDGTHEFYQHSSLDAFRIFSVNASLVNDVFQIRTSRNTSNASYHPLTVYNDGAGAYRLKIADSGDVTNTNNSYTGISDIKLKENVADASSQWTDIKALQVRNYNFKEETGQPTHRQIGLIAQEVELVSPGLVKETIDRDEDGNDLGTTTKSVNYSVLYMKAVKALQEAMERIEVLEAKVAALEFA